MSALAGASTANAANNRHLIGEEGRCGAAKMGRSVTRPDATRKAHRVILIGSACTESTSCVSLSKRSGI
jgi:hypothetical protein